MEMEALQRLDQKVRRIHAARPLPPATLASLRAWLRVETTYTSNAIEGNVLTRQETTVVLEGLTIGGKPLRDHLEALDHAEAFDYMYDLAQRDTPFTETDLRTLHQLVLRRSQPDDAGRYREVQVWIRGAVHVPPPPALVPALMADLFRDLAAWATDHPVRRTARFHGRLAAIHPFIDGNGRTARLAANLLLMRAGYPLAIIPPADRAAYFAALAAFDQGHEEALVEMFAVACERTADIMLQGLVPTESEAEPESDR
ncbi:MAG: Fic family protein [Firmicutes bacterium]|nr:Fic family protein [Bacillota bacterium]